MQGLQGLGLDTLESFLGAVLLLETSKSSTLSHRCSCAQAMTEKAALCLSCSLCHSPAVGEKKTQMVCGNPCRQRLTAVHWIISPILRSSVTRSKGERCFTHTLSLHIQVAGDGSTNICHRAKWLEFISWCV